MAVRNRASLIAKLHKVLKQHYTPIETNGDRPLLQHMLFACCLENAPYDRAEKTYNHLSESFFDWNEVRVSTVKELSEAMRDLPDPTAAASNLKRILQTVFESTYSFELESVKKQNIGAGIKKLGKLEGASPFVVAFATQHALEGHYIPLDRGALEVLYIVGIASEAERDSGSVAGLERAIAKNKGLHFSSLLHQLSADFIANPFSSNLKNLLLSINPDSKHRMPKRGQKKEEVKPAVQPQLQNGKGAAKAAAAAEAQPGHKKGAPKAAPEPAKKKIAGGKELPKPAKKGRTQSHPAMAGAGRAAAGRPAPGRQLTKRKPR